MNPSRELPLVSIITPVYNGAKYLDNLILSVFNQDYPNVEHILIDDGSTDQGATVKVLEKYPHLRWWSRENRGQYPTMNEGLEAATGEIICFISADDVMAENAIRSAVEALAKNPQTNGVYGQYTYIDENNQPYWYQPLIKHASVEFYRYSPFIAHCSLYIEKAALLKHNLYFNPSLRYVGDYDWIVKIIAAGLKIDYLDQILAHVRWHNAQTSNQYLQAIKAELNLTLKNYGVNLLFYRMFNSTIDRLLYWKRSSSLLFRNHSEKEREQVQNWWKSKKGK